MTQKTIFYPDIIKLTNYHHFELLWIHLVAKLEYIFDNS